MGSIGRGCCGFCLGGRGRVVGLKVSDSIADLASCHPKSKDG